MFYEGKSVSILNHPRTERFGVLARGTLDISPTLSTYAEAGFSTSKTFQPFQPP